MTVNKEMENKNMKRNAVLLMTGHTLTLLIDNEAVAGARPNKRSIANLKKYIADRRDTLQFTEDNMTTFPWLRELMKPTTIFRPFDELDWQTFAGAEGNAHIGQVKLAGQDCTVVVANCCVQVFPGEDPWWTLNLPMSAEQLVGVMEPLFLTLAESTLPLGAMLERFGFQVIK